MIAKARSDVMQLKSSSGELDRCEDDTEFPCIVLGPVPLGGNGDLVVRGVNGFFCGWGVSRCCSTNGLLLPVC